MQVKQWLTINKNGITSIRKSKPNLGWDEIAVQLSLNIPDELFKRPTFEASIKVDDVGIEETPVELIINTAALIEQQTGAKINFKIIKEDESNN